MAQAPEGQGVAALPPISVPMGKEAISVGRCAHGRHPVPSVVGHNRRLPLGMGHVWQGRTAQGQWPAQSNAHINVLELRAVQLALIHFLPQLEGKGALGPQGFSRYLGAC